MAEYADFDGGAGDELPGLDITMARYFPVPGPSEVTSASKATALPSGGGSRAAKASQQRRQKNRSGRVERQID